MNRPCVYFDVEIGSVKIGRLEFELYSDLCPRTAENFRCLCTGEKSLSFKGSPFHRIIKGFMVQGGDITCGDGTGGRSIYGEKFDDEPHLKRGKHVRRGLLSMANSGPNTNGSQFFITFVKVPHLDGKHIVFGEVVSDSNFVLDTIEHTKTYSNDRPRTGAHIYDCGQVWLSKSTSSIARNLDKSAKEFHREATMLSQASYGSSFPVPTVDNPLAIYEDDEARQLLQERLDREKKLKLEACEVTSPLNNSDARKRKLLELKSRQAEARSENQKMVLEEHRQFNSKKKNCGNESDGRKWDKTKDEQNSENLAVLSAIGAGKDKAYFLDTAAVAAGVRGRASKKMENIQSSREAHHSNQETLFKSYTKSISKLAPSEGTGCHSKSNVELEYGTDDHVSTKMKIRLAKAMEPRVSKRRVKTRLDEDDVTAINEANEKYNQLINKKLDKYTLEIRKNLERGTAL